ncbi:MAG: cysteine desulfurase [Cyclobacteriaceae bacterium]|nr:cysteine desulfurase [Cyclobacteriaceae bacterium]
MASSIQSIKSAFPIFTHHPDLVYLDNAATSQKPQSVIQAMNDFYEKDNANVHRGLYHLSTHATRHFDEARSKVSDFIGAKPADIAFTKGTTESINIISHGFLKRLKSGDEILLSVMEHHANFIPWQQLCKSTGAKLRIIHVTSGGDIDIEKLDELITSHTKLLALTHISNVLGTINPIEEIIQKAHKKNIPVLIDAAQSAGHYPIDVKSLDVDFLAFSAHKMFGPLGTGVLFVKDKYHDQIDPLNFGGGSIKNVELEDTQFMSYPYNLESGTPHIAGVLGFGAAIDFIQSLNADETLNHTRNLISLFTQRLEAMDFISIVGNPGNRGSIVSFQVKNIHPHDVAGFLGNLNISVRAGHHCAQPLHEMLGIGPTVRVSFSIYNTKEDVNRICDALLELKKFWS